MSKEFDFFKNTVDVVGLGGFEEYCKNTNKNNNEDKNENKMLDYTLIDDTEPIEHRCKNKMVDGFRDRLYKKLDKLKIIKTPIKHINFFVIFKNNFSGYYRFRYYAEKDKAYTGDLYDKFVSIDDLYRAVSYSFEWQTTTEGFDFWSEIDNVWRAFVDNVKKIN